MTKLCNHKRKLLLPAAAASPVASCTPAVSSSTLSSGPTTAPIHANADSPTSSEKTRKDGHSKKKKRKLGGIGGIYSGVSVSQLLAQRERAIAAVAASGVQGSPVPNGSQVWPIAIPNLQVQQNGQQICHQSLNSPSQNHDVNNCTRNPQQRLNQHNMSGMLMGNPLRHHVIQNGGLQSNPHENVQRMYTQNQVQYPVRNFDPSKGTSADGKMGHQQQFVLSNHAGRSPNASHAVEAQSGMGPNGQPGNMHFNNRTPPWQQNRPAVVSHQPSVVTVQNINCNSFDRVPPLHHHIPQASTWTDEAARKKAKSTKVIAKKQRQHGVAESRANNGLEHSTPSPVDEFSEKNQQNNGQIGTTFNNSGPSFLEDPSGYLAQQTALLNSTISRQTGVSSSQMGLMNNNPKSSPQTSHGMHVPNNSNAYLPQPKPSSIASPTSTSSFTSVKNHATSPVVVHSSMTPTSSNSGTDSESSPCQGCVTSADTQSYIQDQYKQQMHRQYLMHTDQREDPVTSSTFGERYQTSQQQQADSRPIQGGTVSTSHGSPIGTNSPANSDTPAASTPGISQPATPQSLISSQPSTPHSYSQPPTPHSHVSGQMPPQTLTPQAQQPSQSLISGGMQEQRSETPCSGTMSSSGIPPSTSPSQTSSSTSDNLAPQVKRQITTRQNSLDGYQPHPHTVNAVSRIPINTFGGASSVITTMASSHTVSSNTITSVLAGRANTATVSINTPSAIPNPALPNLLPNKPQHQAQSTTTLGNVVSGTTVTTHSSVPHNQSSTMSVSKSPLEMVQSVVSSIQVPQASTNSLVQPQTQQQQQHHHHHQQQQQQQQQQQRQQQQQQQQHHHHNQQQQQHQQKQQQQHHQQQQQRQQQQQQQNQQQQQRQQQQQQQHQQKQQQQHQHQQQQQQQHPQTNVQVHNVLTSGGILKHPAGSTLPPGHILVSSGGQLIMASTGSAINGVMAPPPPKIISNANSMPPLSVSPMVTSVTGAVSQVIPAVGVAQQVIGQPTVLVNTIQTPVLIQPSVMTMDGISQNVQIPHLTVATGNVIQNTQSILDANQDVSRTVGANQGMMSRQPALLSPESAMTKKKAYKKRKTNPQTVASMLHIASSQQNAGMLMQSQSNFAQQNFQAQSIGGPMLQALTIVPGKGGAPAQLVMNGQTGAASAQFNAQQIITNPQPAQQINLLQPVNLLNGATGMVQNFPTIQQFIVPGLGSMVMSADGTATLLQDTGNIGMQLQIQNVNGQNVLTPVQSHGGIFNPSQSILAAGPAGMVIRAPQATSGKIIQQHSPGAQFLSPNSGQFLVNGTTSFGNQLSPIVANVSPNQQVTFNTSQVRPPNMQGQQEFIQMNGQTLMVPCATAQNIAVSSASNQQNTTFVQQNTTIVQQQTTMVSNNQIPNFQGAASNGGQAVDPSLNLDHNQSYILSSGMIQGKTSSSPKSGVNSPSSDQNMEQQQYVLASSSTTVVEKTASQNEQHSPLMARHSVSTQTAGNQTNVAQSAMMRQGSPPDTTTHSPGNSQRSNSPAVDTTTHGAASPAPPITARHHSSSTPMVHCVSSSEPDSGDAQIASEDWRIQGITTKEITLNQPSLHGKTYVESTVTTGIQVGTHVEQVNRHLTVIDMHQPADTTHPENTYADSQEHMDTSSPNHSINSDTMDHSTVEDQLSNSKEMTDVSYSEIEVNPLSMIGHGHYQPILYHSQHYVPNANVYRQQALVPDHAHYTMLPQVSNKLDGKQCVDSDRVGNHQIVQHIMEQDEVDQNSEEKPLERHNSGVPYCPQNVTGCPQKFVNVGIAPSGLYPHLYNYRSDPNGIAVVDYSSSKQAYINPYIYTSETLKQAEGVVSTVRCEGREHALGRGIKRKLDSIHSMHSTLHEDQDAVVSRDYKSLKDTVPCLEPPVPETKDVDDGNQWKLMVGELVWGAARGSPAWPGKVESLGPPGTMTVWVRWYGGGGNRTQVNVKTLKSLSEGLEAHHRARKKFRKSRKLNMQLENAIQEAMAELDKMTEASSEQKNMKKSPKVTSLPATSSKGVNGAGKSEAKRSSKRSVATVDHAKAEQKQCRFSEFAKFTQNIFLFTPC
ncbi:Methyl-CpG-binding domain protein 5 [Harpegnathos saltator]|uniref:Methyl-CpG-binding domain protein 5 n=1 Tax=Harpegnathos saltator TaxID=610380 RepID=E2C3N5_HARSA|nr:Methyl-CpG-binding domain protein 5 [Harpegnathos saltator]